MESFDYFWANYPRHVAKKDARKAWDKLNPSPDLVNRMVAAITDQKRERYMKESRRDWVPEWPYAGSWLRGERWTDAVRSVLTPVVERPPTPDEEIDLV